MVAWAATIPMFWAVLGHNLKEGFLGEKLKTAVVYEWAWVVVLLSYLAFCLLILIQFWKFWPTLF